MLLKNVLDLIIWTTFCFSLFKVVNHNNINRYLYNDHEESVLDFILKAGWKANIYSMENSKEISS